MRRLHATMTAPRFRSLVLPVLLLATLLGGCAQKGPILIEGIAYKAPEGLAGEQKSTIMAVSPFRDLREKSPTVIGQRQIRDYISNDLVVRGTAAELVTGAMREALTGRGYRTGSAPDWNLSEAVISVSGTDIVLGGEIRALWIDVATQPFKVRYKAVVQLRVAAVDVKAGKVVRTLNLNSSLEREDISYSDVTVQETLAEALSSAIDQLMNDEEIKKILH